MPEPCGMINALSRSFRKRLRFDRDRNPRLNHLSSLSYRIEFCECGLTTICSDMWVMIHEAGRACGPPRVFVKELHSIFYRCGWRWLPQYLFVRLKLCD